MKIFGKEIGKNEVKTLADGARELKEDCYELLNKSIKNSLGIEELTDLDYEEYELIKDSMKLTEKSLNYGITMAEKTDEMITKLNHLDTKLDGVMEKLERIEKRLDK